MRQGIKLLPLYPISQKVTTWISRCPPYQGQDKHFETEIIQEQTASLGGLLGVSCLDVLVTLSLSLPFCIMRIWLSKGKKVRSEKKPLKLTRLKESLFQARWNSCLLCSLPKHSFALHEGFRPRAVWELFFLLTLPIKDPKPSRGGKAGRTVCPQVTPSLPLAFSTFHREPNNCLGSCYKLSVK